MKEIWNNALGFEGLYQVSNLGKVRTVKRDYFSGRHHTVKKTIENAPLYHRVNRSGYIDVNLRKGKKRRPYTVHRLVYEAFNGAVPNGLVINHKDLNKMNNNLSNLEAITSRENNIHYLKSIQMKCNSIGVRTQTNGFVAQITNKGHRIYLGYFETEDEASSYYQSTYEDIKNNKGFTIVKRRGGPQKYALL